MYTWKWEEKKNFCLGFLLFCSMYTLVYIKIVLFISVYIKDSSVHINRQPWFLGYIYLQLTTLTSCVFHYRIENYSWLTGLWDRLQGLLIKPLKENILKFNVKNYFAFVTKIILLNGEVTRKPWTSQTHPQPWRLHQQAQPCLCRNR